MPQYEVQAGDSLYAIAEKTLGDGNRWREIYEGNADQVGGDPGMIRPGQVLAIPYDQPSYQQGGDHQGPQMQPSGPQGPSSGMNTASQTQGSFGQPQQPTQSLPPEQTAGYWQQKYSTDPQIAGPEQDRMVAGRTRVAGPPQVRYDPLASARPAGAAPFAAAERQLGSPMPEGNRTIIRRTMLPTGAGDAKSPIGQRPYNGKTASGYDQPMGAVTAPPGGMYPTTNLPQNGGFQQGQQGSPAQPQNRPIQNSGFQQGRSGFQQNSPGPRQLSPQELENARAGVMIDNTTLSPTARQELQARGPVRVEWPVAPGTMQQNMPQGVTPSSFQGRFTDQQGQFQAPNAASGYMGRPQQSTYPQQRPPQAMGGTDNMQPGRSQMGVPQRPSSSMPPMTSAPRAVVVIAEDGTQMVYDTRTGEWRTVGGQQQPGNGLSYR